MAIAPPFTVSHDGITMAVVTDGAHVLRIRLNDIAEASPKDRFEREVADQLLEYLTGARIEFTLPMKPKGTPFQRSVWAELTRIPFGETRSYGEVAKAIGQPGASRAVGSANNANPIPILIPCHRVVGSDGSLGGFGGGVELKRQLLAIEARRLIDLPPDRGYLSPVQ